MIDTGFVFPASVIILVVFPASVIILDCMRTSRRSLIYLYIEEGGRETFLLCNLYCVLHILSLSDCPCAFQLQGAHVLLKLLPPSRITLFFRFQKSLQVNLSATEELGGISYEEEQIVVCIVSTSVSLSQQSRRTNLY